MALCPKCKLFNGYPEDEYCMCAYKDRISALESALREIAEHPYQDMDHPDLIMRYKWEWRSGISKGHRCCAEIARKALEGK